MSFIEISTDVVFEAKRDPVPYNYRISYKISLLCLILSICCKRGGASIKKVQIISSSITTEEKFEELKSLISGEKNNYDIFVRFDPAINRAIEFAIADKLIYQQKNGLLKLCTKGTMLAEMIMSKHELLTSEKEKLDNLSGKLTEVVISNITRNMEEKRCLR